MHNSESRHFAYNDPVDADGGQGRSPLFMVPGVLLGVGALVAILVVAYKTWYEHSMPLDEGLAFISVLACAYAVAAYLFSFGYHGGDDEEALKLTGLILL